MHYNKLYPSFQKHFYNKANQNKLCGFFQKEWASEAKKKHAR